MLSLSCDANIAEEDGSSLYEWLNMYKSWEALVYKNKHINGCDKQCYDCFIRILSIHLTVLLKCIVIWW